MMQCSNSRIKLLLSDGMVLSEVSELIFLTITRLVLFRKKCPESSKTFTSLFSAFSYDKRFCLSGSGGKWERD